MRTIQRLPTVPRPLALLAILAASAGSVTAADDDFRPVPLQGRVTGVQPMTGIVLWTTSEHNRTDAIQLEYRYVGYDEVVDAQGAYDWSQVDTVLDEVAARGHQAILRFYFVYPGRKTTAPAFLKAMPEYRETEGTSEGRPTSFPDWSNRDLKQFVLEFYKALAERYDDDRRLAFLQTGFGLWAEYHIYDGPMELGRTFPDRDFQAEFVRHLGNVFRSTPWMISIDAAEASRTPFASRRELLDVPFGLFDDSFLHEQHGGYNARSWAFFGRDRWQIAPAGGEFSYYTRHDQREALAPNGPHGTSFEQAAADYHITFLIGNAQPQYQPIERIRAAGLACGYRFRVVAFEASPTRSRVTITNTGIAPIYHDAFPAVDGNRAGESLKGLLPGAERTFLIEAGGDQPRFSIESDRLVDGQRIEFEADLDGGAPQEE